MALRELGQHLGFGRNPQEASVPLLRAIPTRDKLFRGVLSLALLCHDNAYSDLNEPGLEWPHGLQPARSFRAPIETKRIHSKLRGILGIEETTPEVKLIFGERWGSANAMLYVKSEAGEGVLVLSAQLKPDVNHPHLRATHFPDNQLGPKNLSLSQRKLRLLLAETTLLALGSLNRKLQINQST